MLFLFSSVLLFADAGYCILYKAKFNLKNGQSVTGYFRYSTYDSLKLNFTEKAFNSFVDKLFENGNDTLLIFLRIQSLKYPKIANGTEEYLFPAIVEEDIYRLTRNDIISSHFLDYLPHFEKDNSDMNLFLDCGANSLISELNQNEIDLLQKPPVAYYYCIPRNKIVEEAYELLSYNPEINESDLILCCDRFKKLDDIMKNCKERNLAPCYLSEYSKIKKEFAERKIVLFRY